MGSSQVPGAPAPIGPSGQSGQSGQRHDHPGETAAA